MIILPFFRNKCVLAIVRSCDAHFFDTEILSPREYERFNLISSEKRCREYYLGRMAAKKALIELDSSLKLSEISIINERSGYPAIENSNYCVSITHTNEIAASLVFPKEFSLGIDIEDIKRSENIKRIITESVPNTPEFLTAAWTLKESLSKALKCGFSKPTNVFELSALTKEDNFFVCLYKQHSDFQGIAVVYDPYLLAITYPKSLESTEMFSLMEKTSSCQI